MQAWLHHLIINQLLPQNTYLLSIDENLCFTADKQDKTLEKLIDFYIQGQQQPDIFFTEASFAYVQQVLKLNSSKRAKTPAINIAKDKLEKEISFDRSLQLLYKNMTDFSELLNDDFEAQCNDLIFPAWELIKKPVEK